MSTIYGNPLLLGGGGVKLNIDYGTNPPSDTSKLWVPRATVPSSVEAKYEFKFGNEQLAVDNYNYIPTQDSSNYGSCQVGDYIYHYYWQSNATAYFQRYDMNSGTWEKLATPTNSTGKSFTWLWQNSMLATEDKIYMFGGRYSSATYMTTVLEYDISTNTITNVSNAPFTMAFGVWVKAGDVAYGFACFNNGGYNRVAKYDFTTKETTEVSAEFTFDTTSTVPTSRTYYPFDAGNGIFYLLPLENSMTSDSTSPLLKVDLGAKTVEKYSTVANLFPAQKWTVNSSSHDLNAFAFNTAGIVQIGSTGYIFGGTCANLMSIRPSPYIFKVGISSNGLTVNPLDVYLFSTYISSVFYRAAGILNNKIHIVQYYSQATDATYRNNQTLTLYSPLDSNKLFLQTGFGNNKFNIVNDNKAKIEIAINNAFIGNSENKADETNAYLYSTNDSKWKNIKTGNLLKTLNEYTWAEIRQISDANKAIEYGFKPGDTKTITISGTIGNTAVNQTVDAVVIGINHNSEKEGNNRIHFLIGKSGVNLCGMKDEKYAGDGVTTAGWCSMNTSLTNAGGWDNSYMRKTFLGNTGTPTAPTANTFLAALPADLRAEMKSCIKYSDNIGEGSNPASAVTATTDYLFLLAEFEI